MKGRIQMMREGLRSRKKGGDHRPRPNKKVVMIISSIQAVCPTDSDWQSQWEALAAAEPFPAMVWSALQLGLLFARWVLSSHVNERAQAPQVWPVCEQCGRRLRSIGFRSRQLSTVIGVVV